MTQLASKKPSSADRAAPAAFLHRPRHHRERRLCLAEGRQMAGGAARSLDPGPGYPQLSRSRERLYRKPARPHRSAAKEAGGGDARRGSRRTIPACPRRTGRSPICANSARAASTRCSAARRAMAARSSIVLDGDALAAGEKYFKFGGSRHSPDHRLQAWSADIKGLGIFFDPRARLGKRRRPRRSRRGDRRRRGLEPGRKQLLLRQARRQPSPDAGVAASTGHEAGRRCADL